jgi:hypothetical protein
VEFLADLLRYLGVVAVANRIRRWRRRRRDRSDEDG